MKHLIPEFDGDAPALSRRASSRRWCCRACAASRKTAASSPTSDIDGLAAYLGVPRIQIEEVLSFYTPVPARADRPLASAGLPQPLVLAARRRGIARASRQARHRARPDHGRRPLHAVDGRMPRLVRHRAGGDGQRDLPREHEPGAARRPAREPLDDDRLTQAAHDLPGHRDLAQARRLPRARRLCHAREGAARDAPGGGHEEVAASGILGHGGAAFPAGRKWGVIKLNDGQPHYLCANADEGEPGTFKDRWILENAPHLLLESMVIAAYALQVRHAFIYIRGEFDLPYRRIAAAVEEAYAAGWLGERIAGSDFALRPRRLSRRRLVRLRRGLGPADVARRQAGLPAQPAAAPHGARPLPAADRDQQRRDARQRHRHRRATAPPPSARSARRRARARS